MRQLLSKSWKRIVASILALTLVIGCTGGWSVRAASSDMSVASVLNFSTANGDWRFNFNMNGNWPTSGDFDAYTNTSLSAEIKNASGEVLATVSGSTMECYKNGPYWMLCIWGVYTASNAPANGDTITISSGQMTYASDDSSVVNLTKDTVLTYDGTNWSVVEEQIVEGMSVDSVLSFSTSGDWRFHFNMNGTWPTTGDFDNYTNTSITVTIKNALGEILATVEGSTLENYKNGPYWLLVIWGTYTGSNAPAEGDTITISSGQLAYADDETKIVNFAEETVLEYDGENWSVYVEPIVYTYTDISLVWGDFPSNKPDTTSGYWDLYVSTSEALPGIAHTTVYSDIKVMTGETEIPAIVKKVEDNLLNIFIMDESTLPVTAPAGTKITIKAGQSLGNDLGTLGINITEDFTMVLGEDGKMHEYEEVVVYEYTDMSLVWGDFPSNKPNVENGYWDLYVSTSEALPGTAHTTVYGDIKVMTGETEIPATVKKAGDNLLNIFIMDESTLPVTVAAGTEITIKAGQSLGSDLETAGINITEDFTMVLGEDGRLSEMGTEVELEYVDITPNQFTKEISNYDSKLARWNIYVTIEGAMPGNPWEGYFGELIYAINGETFTAEGVYHAGEYGLFFYIPDSVLAADFTGNKTIVLKSGYGTPSIAGGKGIYLTKDITIYANQYGWSAEGFVEPVKIKQTNAVLTLDKDTVYGGNEHGLYLNTNDTFKVDTTWQTKIWAFASDANSGVFYNGTKVNAPLIKYQDGKAYVGLADAGITAKDKDKVTVKGAFELDGYGVSYKEVTFYYNGKLWGTEYEAAKAENYTKIAAESVNNVSSWSEHDQRWNVYLNVNAMLPGEIDKISFSMLKVEINGKTVDTVVYHSYQDTLFFPIEKQYLPENCADGTKITIKAGKALAADKSTGIELTKDFTFYTYKGILTDVQPTSNTSWQEITVISMNTTAAYSKVADVWNVHLKLKETLDTESGTVYLDLPICIDGKTYTIKAMQDGVFLMLSIPGTILPGNTKKATVSVEAGAKAYANGGKNGVQFKEEFNAYAFNGVISEQEFDEVQEYEARIVGLQNAVEDGDKYHVYLRLNKEFPGTAWYEIYDDFVYYYNGKKIEGSARKSESSNGKFMYFGVEKSVVGTPKDGDIIKVAADTVMNCGGYKMTITNDFLLMYEDGLWSQYVETDVKAPEDNKSLWEIARFDKEYIPTTEDGSVLYSNEDTYNRISSLEPMKDFTVSFNAKKFYDDETTPSFGVILRGNAISEDEEMTESLLNGYVITFSVLEVKESEDSNEEGIWTGYISLWKNGVNHSLLDQYRISYVHDKSDHPHFQYDVDYNYEFSIYNITETCVCITVKINGELAMRYYDEAGSDPFDPAINAGTFQVFAGCPNYITDDIAELTEIISEKDECLVGDKVRVAATYPSVIEGAEFIVDKDGATVEEGVFVATKPGTYTITGTYKGKELSAKTITVTEAESVDEEEDNQILVLPLVVVAVVAVAGVITIALFAKNRKKKEQL